MQGDAMKGKQKHRHEETGIAKGKMWTKEKKLLSGMREKHASRK